MKNRMACYVKPIKEQEKILKFKNGDNKEEIPVLHKKYFDKDKDKDKIAGYVHLKNKKYYNNKYGTLTNTAVDDMDIYSDKQVYQRIVGYVQTADGEYLGVTSNIVLIILFIIGILLIAFGIFTIIRQPDVPAPDFSDVVEEEKNNKYDLVARVVLPDGKVTFDGEVYTPEDEKKKQGGEEGDYEPYSGEATVRVTITIDDTEHVLVDTTKVKISKGKLPDVTIDFTKLDFELKPGTYIGNVHIVYSDGSEVDKPIEIVIVDSSSGNAGIGFSDKIDVSLSKSKLTLKYEYDEATSNAIVQVIAVKNDKEILLAESGVVKSGQTITELKLDKSAKAKIKAGAYNGIMRVYFDDRGASETTDLKTDIECKIYVK